MAKQSTSSERRVTKETATSRKTQSQPVGQRTQLDWSWTERTSVRLAGLFVIGVLVGGFLLSGLRSVGADQPMSSSRWQYGCLSVSPSQLSWSTPGEEYVARTPDDLYKQITKSDPPGGPGEMTALHITNLIGGRGWELTSVTGSKDRRGADEYWFTRTSR